MNQENNCKMILENGTIIGALTENHSTSITTKFGVSDKNLLIIPEIVISSSYSNNSLNRSRIDIVTENKLTTNSNLNPSIITKNHTDENDTIAESTALLGAHSDCEIDACLEDMHTNEDAQQSNQTDDFEQFMLNRSTSESNVLDSSIYSELQFQPSISSCGSTILQQQQHLTTTQATTSSSLSTSPPPPPSTTATSATIALLSSSQPLSTTATIQSTPTPPLPPSSNAVVDILNSSACSRESRQSKRTRRKHKSKSKCNATAAAMATTVSAQRATPTGVVMTHGTYPPQYTALFLDPHMQHHHHHHHAGSANAMGQIANAAVSTQFLNSTNDANANSYLQQQFQYYQQRPMMTSMPHFNHHRTLLDTVPNEGALPTTNSNTGIATAPSTARSLLAASSPFRVCFRKWFSRPSLPFVIGILALGGVACTLGGIVLGSTGLVEHSTQYLSAALLMIGIGVSLLVISGAIWRLSLPDDVDECPCYRHMEACRNCNSPYCNNRLLPGSYLYPEFQHRPPPPSYLTSLNECAAMGLLFHPAAQAQQAVYGHPLQRINTPPPLYRSTNSLSVVVPAPSGGTISNTATSNNLLQTHNTTNGLPSTDGILQNPNVITMSAVMENLQAQQRQFTKEINYLDLD